MCGSGGVLFDEELALCLLIQGSNLGLEDRLRDVTNVLDINIQQVSIDTLSDAFLRHLTSDVQNILALHHTLGSKVTHEQRLTNTSTSQCNVKCLVRETTLSNLVEVIQTERGTLLLQVIEIITSIVVSQIVMTNMVIEGDSQSLR